MTERHHSPDHAHLIRADRQGNSTRPHGIVVLVHGGRATSRAVVRAGQFAVLRMRPYAAALVAADPDLAVYRLQLAHRGWNGTGSGPVRDLRWALDIVRSAHPGAPIVLVGHSMGARTCLLGAGEAGVTGVVALAPWVTADEPIAQLLDRRVRVVHGANDRWVPESSTRPYLNRIISAEVDVQRMVLPGTGHGMLRRWSDWNRLLVADVADLLTPDVRATADATNAADTTDTTDATDVPHGRHARH